VIFGHAVVGDDSQLGAVAAALAVGEPELIRIREHLGDGIPGVPGGLGQADVFGEQVDQDDAAEVGGGRLELDRDAVEHPLGQLVLLPPAPRQAVAFPLVLGERPGRVRDLEGPLLAAQDEPVDRDPRPVRRRSRQMERIHGDLHHRVPDDLEEVQLGARRLGSGRRDLDDQILAPAGDDHRRAGQDGVRFRGVERVGDVGGPVELTRPYQG
jgi:hypothetical protein